MFSSRIFVYICPKEFCDNRYFLVVVIKTSELLIVIHNLIIFSVNFDQLDNVKLHIYFKEHSILIHIAVSF